MGLLALTVASSTDGSWGRFALEPSESLSLVMFLASHRPRRIDNISPGRACCDDGNPWGGTHGADGCCGHPAMASGDFNSSRSFLGMS